jgi:hypothetical protein
MLDFRIIIVICLLVTAHVSEAIGGSAAVFSGTYEYIVHPESASPSFIAHYNFEISLSGCLWIISYEDISALTNTDTLTAKGVASYDGTNIYLVQFQSDQAVKKAWGDRYASVKGSLPIANAEIFPGDYPPPKPFVLQKLWFAFASGCVFNGTSGKAKSPSYADLAIFYNTNNECSYEWITNVNQPDMRQIVIKSDGSILSRNRNTGSVDHFSRPGYDKGYTMGVGVWSQMINLGGFNIPRKFEYSEFAPLASNNNSVGQFKTYTYKCIVTNMSGTEVGQIPAPLVDGSVLVTDRRFIDKGYAKVNYIASNGWIAADDKYITDQLNNRPKMTLDEEVVRALKVPPKHSQSIRYAIWILLALPSCLLLLWGVFGKQTNKQTNKQTKVNI